MRYMPNFPKQVCVETSPGVYALGVLKHTAIDGKYIIHLDGECAEHAWEPDDVEFMEDGN